MMADCRKHRKNGNYKNRYCMDGQLLLIIILVLISQCSTFKRESNITNCNNLLTCTKCTTNHQCQWSLKLQECISISKTPLNYMWLIVSSAEKCPRFSVVKYYYYYDKFINLEYIVKVPQDREFDFISLFGSSLKCTSPSIIIHSQPLTTSVDLYYKRIICSASVSMEYFKKYSKHSFTEFISIQLNDGNLLRFDNVIDHYVTFYEHECAEGKENEYCATCTWTKDDGYAHFVRLCSSNNSCEGHNEFHKFHNGKGKFRNSNSLTIKDECTDIKVINVDPLSGPRFNDTVVMITVKNHMIFAENRKLTVLVAGEDCINPKMSGPETITCIISPSLDYVCNKLTGPILVMYSSSDSKLTIESSQIFEIYVNNTFGVSTLSTDCSLQYPESEHTRVYSLNCRSKFIRWFTTTMFLMLFCLLINYLIGYLRMYRHNALNTDNARYCPWHSD